jgi:hypothetical protein
MAETGSQAERVVLGQGRTESITSVDFALSAQGEQLATAVDGTIWVSRVEPRRTKRAPTSEALVGAGSARKGTLRFLGQHHLVSGSGTAVSLWDLAQKSRLGPSVPIHHDVTCNGCPPGSVWLDPSGKRALVTDQGRTSASLVDLDAGTEQYSGDAYEGAPSFTGVYSVWLDDQRLLTWEDAYGVATVFAGPRLEEVESSWTSEDQIKPPDADPPAALVLAVVGHDVLLADTDGRVLRLDTGAQTTTELPRSSVADGASALGLDRSQTRSWSVTHDSDTNPDADPDSTHVAVTDLSTGAVIRAATLPGHLSDGDLNGDVLRMWSRNAPLTLLDISSGEITTVPQVQMRLGSAVSHDGRMAVFERDGVASIRDLDLNATVGSFAVPTYAYAWTETDFSPSDAFLALATEARDETGHASVRRMAFGYDSWTDLACRTAGRSLSLAEWTSQTSVPPPARLAC